MTIRLTRGDEAAGKRDTLTCRRSDGTITWSTLHPGFAYHDLAHYAVETTLGYTQAFYGLVEGGRAIDSFGTRAGVRDPLPAEAVFTEMLTSLVQGTFVPNSCLTLHEMLALVKFSCDAVGLTPLPLTGDELISILACRDTLWARWDHTAATPHGFLELVFLLFPQSAENRAAAVLPLPVRGAQNGYT